MSMIRSILFESGSYIEFNCQRKKPSGLLFWPRFSLEKNSVFSWIKLGFFLNELGFFEIKPSPYLVWPLIKIGTEIETEIKTEIKTETKLGLSRL